jgi:tetratricopeptide (TPR) repeat protein
MADYDAFISYSHAQDKPIAAALQTAVQRLGKPWYRRRALRMFRDDTSLAATPHLWPSIEEALARSRYLVLLVSPQSAASPWVGKEVAYWLANKSIDTFLLAVTDGEVGWDNTAADFVWSPETPLPAALKGRFTAEPKWVDLREYRNAVPARKGRFLDLAADLAATIHGIPKEDLLSLEVRQQRRALTLAWSAVATLLVLTAGVGWQWQVARTQRAKAENALTAATGTADRLVFDMALELRNRPGMPVDTVVRILGGMQAMQDELLHAANDSPELRRHQAIALGELATTLSAQGALATARNDAERAVAIMANLVKLDPANTQYQRELAVNINKLGDVRLRSGEVASALDTFTQALALIQKRADAAPGDLTLQADLAACLANIGSIQAITAKQAAALDSFRRAAGILEKLVTEAPQDLAHQYELSQAENRIGLVLKSTGQNAAALAAFQAGLAIRQKLVAAKSDNTEYQRGLFDNYTWTGDMLARNGARDDALQAYRNALPSMEKLAASDLGNKQWQNELSVGYENIGQMLALSGANDEALSDFRKSLAIREQLSAADAGNVRWQHEISVSYNKIADVQLAAGRRSDALNGYQKALDIALKLSIAEPDNADWQSDLAFCYQKVGDVAAADDPERARGAYQQSITIRRKLVEADANDVQLRRNLALSYERFALLAAPGGSSADAIASLRQAVVLRKQIAASDPDNPLWQFDLALPLFWLAQAGDDPRSHYQEALAITQKPDVAGTLSPDQKSWIANIAQTLAAPHPQR